MIDMIITAAIFLIGGLLIATAYWLSINRAHLEGYNAGYKQAMKEHADKEMAANMARWKAEQQYKARLVQGFPSADPVMVEQKPLGMEVAE